MELRDDKGGRIFQEDSAPATDGPDSSGAGVQMDGGHGDGAARAAVGPAARLFPTLRSDGSVEFSLLVLASTALGDLRHALLAITWIFSSPGNQKTPQTRPHCPCGAETEGALASKLPRRTGIVTSYTLRPTPPCSGVRIAFMIRNHLVASFAPARSFPCLTGVGVGVRVTFAFAVR